MAIPQDARHIANQQGDFVPQHQNNFMVEIAGLTGNDKDLIVLSMLASGLPKEHNDPVEIPYGNEIRKVAGRAKFDDIELKVHDYVDRETRAALIRWRRLVYDSRTGNIGLPSAYKKTADIILEATDGSHQRICRLTGVWPSVLDPGTLDMTDDKPVEITCTLTYDLADWQL